MATEMQKPRDRELDEELLNKALETDPTNPSLTDRLDESSNPSTRPSMQPSTEDPLTEISLKEREESKESESPSAEVSLGSTATETVPVSIIQKKIRRAERFGMPVQLSEEEKRNSRAERFGTGSTLHGSDELKKSEEQKRKARADRFGLPAQSGVEEEGKKKARLARFSQVLKTDTVEEDKRKARAIRSASHQPFTFPLSFPLLDHLSASSCILQWKSGCLYFCTSFESDVLLLLLFFNFYFSGFQNLHLLLHCKQMEREVLSRSRLLLLRPAEGPEHPLLSLTVRMVLRCSLHWWLRDQSFPVYYLFFCSLLPS
ncbi:hypothetical protein HHK36_016521 [Tetracentron sinense]|uniref:THO1-MOS11 C-terminal domain-containing protein n=1 Tax=Tetracentron sinense TaxID=13715 RepID=A0A834Z2X0_TETSI|nr:hypothetical protein HHK36_016521 [Tetracentron sinense]